MPLLDVSLWENVRFSAGFGSAFVGPLKAAICLLAIASALSLSEVSLCENVLFWPICLSRSSSIFNPISLSSDFPVSLSVCFCSVFLLSFGVVGGELFGVFAGDGVGVGLFDDAADDVDVDGNVNGEIFFFHLSNVSLVDVFLDPLRFLGLAGLVLFCVVFWFEISLLILSSASFSTCLLISSHFWPCDS